MVSKRARKVRRASEIDENSDEGLVMKEGRKDLKKRTWSLDEFNRL